MVAGARVPSGAGTVVDVTAGVCEVTVGIGNGVRAGSKQAVRMIVARRVAVNRALIMS